MCDVASHQVLVETPSPRSGSFPGVDERVILSLTPIAVRYVRLAPHTVRFPSRSLEVVVAPEVLRDLFATGELSSLRGLGLSHMDQGALDFCEWRDLLSSGSRHSGSMNVY